MISPVELEAYVRVMRAGGCLLFKSGETVIQLGPAPAPADARPPHKRDDYGDLLFAATEGLPSDDEEAS